jgi:Uma2 family endonuclease
MTIALGRYEAKLEDEDFDEDDNFYPVSDGKPMGETELHRDLMIYTIEALRVYFAGKGRGYASGNNFLYWEEGNPRAVVCPDAYVVYGVDAYQRDIYKVWEEGGITPAVVFEFTSRKTRQEDRQKRSVYESVLRVPELFLFDPTGKRRAVRLEGFRLVDGRYEALPLVNNRMMSEQLGLELVPDGKFLRFADPHTGQWLLTPFEQAIRADQEAQRSELLAKRLQEEERQRRAAAQGRDEAERKVMEEEAARLAAELRAEDMQTELERLRAELARIKQP